jgi:DNA-binding NarL/FixJ family response regulator
VTATKLPVPILIFDEDRLFREAVRNFLLTAGCAPVDVARTAPEALANLNRCTYLYVFIGMSGYLFQRGRQLALQARQLQPGAHVFPLIDARDQPLIHDDAFEYIIKESVFSTMLELLGETGGKT